MNSILITINGQTFHAELNGSETAEQIYWPPGNAFCIFFGPTPVSRGNTPRAYSPVNVFGRLLGDIEPLRAIGSGATVRVTVA